MRFRPVRIATLLLVFAVVGLTAGTAGPATMRSAGHGKAKGIPAFALTVPPGGIEGSRSLSAHWFITKGARLPAGSDVWVIGSFYFPHDMPIVRDWAVVWNFHTVGGDIGWPIGVSPVRVDITNGLLHVLTLGAGSLAKVDGVTQPVDVRRFAFPQHCNLPILHDQWTDWVMHVKLDDRHGFVKLWQRGQLIVDARNVPTLYSNEKFVELWTGFYTNGASNPGQTFAMSVEVPRIGATYRSAVAATPQVTGSWGSLQYDPSTVTPLSPRSKASFHYPRTLGGRPTCSS